jgi:hypothetical protein
MRKSGTRLRRAAATCQSLQRQYPDDRPGTRDSPLRRSINIVAFSRGPDLYPTLQLRLAGLFGQFLSSAPKAPL